MGLSAGNDFTRTAPSRARVIHATVEHDAFTNVLTFGAQTRRISSIVLELCTRRYALTPCGYALQTAVLCPDVRIVVWYHLITSTSCDKMVPDSS